MVKLYDVVALTANMPDHGLARGQVGTVIQEWEPGVFEVEFSNQNGVSYAMVALRADQLMVLHFEPEPAV